METIITICLVIPLPVCGFILSIYLKSDIINTMMKYDKTFTGLGSNTFDLIRIYKVYTKSTNLTIEEKKLLKLTLIIFFIGFIDGMILTVFTLNKLEFI